MTLQAKAALFEDNISYNTCISACEFARKDLVAHLMAEMRSSLVEADLVTFNSIISSCENLGFLIRLTTGRKQGKIKLIMLIQSSFNPSLKLKFSEESFRLAGCLASFADHGMHLWDRS